LDYLHRSLAICDTCRSTSHLSEPHERVQFCGFQLFLLRIHMRCDWTVSPPFTSVVVIGHDTENDLFDRGANSDRFEVKPGTKL